MQHGSGLLTHCVWSPALPFLQRWVPVRQTQLHLRLSDSCSCQGRPRGLWPVSREERERRDSFSLPHCCTHTFSLQSLSLHGGLSCEMVTLDTCTQQWSGAMNTCVTAATGVQPWYMASPTHLGDLKIHCHPITSACILWRRKCRQGLTACVVVQQYCIVMTPLSRGYL